MSEETTDATGQSDRHEKKRHLPWYAWDVVLLGGVLLFGIWPYAMSILMYLHGRRNESPFDLLLSLFFYLSVPIGIGCLVAVVVRMMVTWPERMGDRWRCWKVRGAVTAVLVAYLGVPFTSILPPGYKMFARGFQTYARTQIDFPAIRGWLATVDPNRCKGIEIWPSDPNDTMRAELPEAIVRHDPFFVRLSLDERGRPVMRVGWAMDLGDVYELVVGPEDMAIPKTIQPEEQTHPGGAVVWLDGEYRLPVAPGAYFCFVTHH